MTIGISGYGSYIPRYRITVEEIAKVWGSDAEAVKNGLLLKEKSVPSMDEDAITISTEASLNAIARAGIDPKKIGAVYIGSESHPYAVKPSSTVVAEAVGATPFMMGADLEWACKAGSAAIQICMGLVKSGYIDYGLAIGADTSQGRPGDALEYSAAAGGGAFIIGKNPAAIIENTCSFGTDTPDFFRREGESYPSHGGRFTGEPAYFNHVISATKEMLKKAGTEPSDYDYCVLHMPNGKFPLRAAKKLGFTKEQIEPSLIVKKIGNTYSGSSLLGLCSVLDIAKPDNRILVTSYGSGAGSDSFSIKVTERINEIREKSPLTDYYADKRKIYITYGEYAKMRNKLKR